MPAFPEDSVSEAPASPSVLQEAMEGEELALVTWTTSQDSRGPPSRLARVSTRTSMRLETEASSSEVAAATLRNGAMTIHNETIADFTFVSRPHAKDPLLRPLLVRRALPFAKPRSLGSSPPSPSRRYHPVRLIPPPLPRTGASPPRERAGRCARRGHPSPREQSGGASGSPTRAACGSSPAGRTGYRCSPLSRARLPARAGRRARPRLRRSSATRPTPTA